MKLIHIINGTFGYKQKPYVIPITRNDPPIEVDDETAKDLVERGVAEYVEPVKEAKKESDEKAPAEPKKTETKPQTKGTAKKSAPAKGKAEDKAPVLTAEEVVE
jgi:topoisomerase IA-like protein